MSVSTKNIFISSVENKIQFDIDISFITSCNCITCQNWKKSSILHTDTVSYWTKQHNLDFVSMLIMNYCDQIVADFYFRQNNQELIKLNIKDFPNQKVGFVYNNKIAIFCGEVNLSFGNNDDILNALKVKHDLEQAGRNNALDLLDNNRYIYRYN